LSRIELARMLGIRDYCFSHYNVRLGEREARLWGRVESGLKSSIKNFVMNRKVFQPVGHQGIDEIQKMLKWKPDYIYGYSSLLLEAARLLENANIDFSPPKCIICTAETILPSQKAFISKVFNAPIAEEYGSTEFDILAFECKNGHRHLVNPWLILEIEDDSCLISDISRKTQDLVRYQLGDSLSIEEAGERCLGSKKIVGELRGRTIERFFYINETDKIHVVEFSHYFDRYFEKFDIVFGFTIIQNKFSQLDVVVQGLPEQCQEGLASFLENEVSRIAGADVTVKVSGDQERPVGQKKNYFIQNLEVHE
jgi:phenylacetate-CoA ligase